MKYIYFLTAASFCIAASYGGDGEAPKPDPKPKKMTGAPQAALGLGDVLGAKLKKIDREGDQPPRREIVKKPVEIKSYDVTLRSLNSKELTWKFLTSQAYKKHDDNYPGRSIGLTRVPSEGQMDQLIATIKDIASVRAKPIVKFDDSYFAKIEGWYRTASFSHGDASKTGAELGQESPYYEAYLKQLGYYFMMAVGEDGVTEELREQLKNVCRLSDEKITSFLEYLPKEKKAAVIQKDDDDELDTLDNRRKNMTAFLLKNLAARQDGQPKKKAVVPPKEDDKDAVVPPKEDDKDAVVPPKEGDNKKPKRVRAVIAPKVDAAGGGAPIPPKMPPPPPPKMQPPPIANGGGLGGINADMFKNFVFNKNKVGKE